MQYYIPLSFWQLVNALSSERLRYHQDESKGHTKMVLSTRDWDSDYSIRIDERLLESKDLSPISEDGSLFIYPKDIELYLDLVSFRFKTSELLDEFISRSSILLEVKGIEKYRDSFVVASISTGCSLEELIKLSPSLEPHKDLGVRSRQEQLRGALIGYVQGATFSVSNDLQAVILQLKELKNTLAGLHTEIMMMKNNSLPQFEYYHHLVGLCQQTYLRTVGEDNMNFDTLSHTLTEIGKLVGYRAQLLSSSYQRSSRSRLSNLKQYILEIEDRYGMTQLRRELDEIKRLERINGERVGKRRVYFKKDSPEYKRKSDIKLELETFTRQNKEYCRAKEEAERLSQELNAPDACTTTLGALCTRLSDLINNILSKLSRDSVMVQEADLSSIVIHPLEGVRIQNPESNEEIAYFNEVLKLVLSQPSDTMISESSVLSLIERSANAFKETEYAQSERGGKLVEALRNYYLYKTNRIRSFALPLEMPILSSIIAFYLKPLSYEQIERYMQNKGLAHTQYAYMLWGASKGYSNIPKTFTHKLYEECRELVKQIDLLLLQASHTL